MSASDSPAPVPISRLGWPTRLRPFRSVVWPGTGPQPDLERDWPELAFIGLAVLLFWRGATPADAPDMVGVAARAILHPVFGLPVALLGVTDGARYALPRESAGRSGRHVVVGRRSGVGAARTTVGQPDVYLRRRGRGWVAGRTLWPRSWVSLDPVGAGLCSVGGAVAQAPLRRLRSRSPGAHSVGGRFWSDLRHGRCSGALPAGGGHEATPQAALHRLAPGRGADRRADRAVGFWSGRGPDFAAACRCPSRLPLCCARRRSRPGSVISLRH